MPIKFLPFYYRTELLNGVESSVKFEPITIEEMAPAEIVRGYRTFQLANPPTDFKYENDSKMFNSVFQNIEEHLGEVTSLVIVPDGEQYNARFSSAKSFRNIPLCFKYNLSISPSIAMIIDTNTDTQASQHIQRLLIIGDPRSNLPYAIEESKILADMFQMRTDWMVDSLIGFNASKKRIIKSILQCSIIHIAAHANLKTDTLQVLRGSILLSLPESGLF